MQRTFKTVLASSLFVAAGLASGIATAGDITGAGSTFAYPIYAKWAAIYKAKTGVGLNYQSIGSGGGIKQIEAKTVDFGASDMPLTEAELKKAGLVQFPAVTGGVVPVVHLAGIQPGQMKLNGKVLADIYLGKVKKWNDPEIAALNNGLKLPATTISVVHRSDGSGTTFIFSNYLSKVSPEWKSKIGFNTAIAWPAGVGGKGNEGVAAYVQRINGAIGYVEYAYALQNHMTHTQMENKAGKFVEPNLETFQAAAGGAHWNPNNGYYEILTNEPGANSWPITGGTFVLMHAVQDKPANGAEVLKFFAWAFANGAPAAKELQYVPLPASVTRLIEKNWKTQIKSTAGKPIF